MTPTVNCFLKCEPFTWSIRNAGTTWQCLCTLSLRMSITRQLDSNFMGFAVQFTYSFLTFSTVDGTAKLRLPMPFSGPWFRLSKPGVLNGSPNNSRASLLPDAVSESKFRAIPHRPHSLYPFIRQDTSELILCLGSCETCCTNCGSADSGVCTDFITHV